MLRPSGPLRLCRRQQKQQSFALSSNGPSTRPPQGHTLADLPVGTVLRVKGPPAINRFSVSRPRLQNSPRFPQAASTSPRRKRSINPDLLSLSLGYLLSKPRSSASRERCTNIWFNKTVPRSLALALSPDRPSFLRITNPSCPSRYPPGPSIQSRSCGCIPPRFPARVATPCRRIRRISCRHRLAIAYSAALAAGGAFFVSTNSSSFLSRPDDKKTLQTPRLPEIVKHQELGPAKHTSFATSELPATFTASLQTLPSTGYPSG
jgi:hypothetical protein